MSPCDETPDASENPTRLINVGRELAMNMFVGESADKIGNRLILVCKESVLQVCKRSHRPALLRESHDLPVGSANSVSQI